MICFVVLVDGNISLDHGRSILNNTTPTFSRSLEHGKVLYSIDQEVWVRTGEHCHFDRSHAIVMSLVIRGMGYISLASQAPGRNGFRRRIRKLGQVIIMVPSNPIPGVHQRSCDTY